MRFILFYTNPLPCDVCCGPSNLSINSHFVQMWFYRAIYAHFAYFILRFFLLSFLPAWTVLCSVERWAHWKCCTAQRYLHNTNRMQVVIVYVPTVVRNQRNTATISQDKQPVSHGWMFFVDSVFLLFILTLFHFQQRQNHFISLVPMKC